MITDTIIRLIFGSQHERDIKKLLPVLHQVNSREAWAVSLTAEQFREKTAEFRSRFAAGESLDDLLPEAFALAREAARRVLGERPYDVQMLGSIVLHSGKIVEMKTGEGKTLMSVSAAYLNSLTGRGVHIVTVNDYLAERDADWMRPVYSYLGVSVGSILSNMDNETRRRSYQCDITYATNNELGFDYLRDNMKWSHDEWTQRDFSYAIVDEIDSILIDEARTPLIISGSAEDDTARVFDVDKFVNQLVEVEKNPETGEYPDELQGETIIGDYTLDEKNRKVSFTDQGMNHIEEILAKHNLISGSVFEEQNFEYIHYFTQAVRAHRMYKPDVDYVDNDGQVQIVDEFTGRILEGRRYGDGLHQAIEAKEKIRIAQRNRTMATITFQNFFRMYDKLSGMTGTADTEAVEFNSIYGIDVVVIPTNLPVARVDEDDIVYLNESDKWNALCDEIENAHKRGQPVLVGTVSIEKSEHISRLLTKRGIRHEVLNAKNHAREALIIAEAGAKGAITIATNMAGRGTDIKLGGNPEYRARKRAGTAATEEEYLRVYKEEFKKWQNDYREVKEAGGLYVIGTERHESRRIDNQLRGRSGRQGDPGRSRFFISLMTTSCACSAVKTSNASWHESACPMVNQSTTPGSTNPSNGLSPRLNNETTKYESTCLNTTTYSMNNVPSYTNSGTASLMIPTFPPAYSQPPRKRSTLPWKNAQPRPEGTVKRRYRTLRRISRQRLATPSPRKTRPGASTHPKPPRKQFWNNSPANLRKRNALREKKTSIPLSVTNIYKQLTANGLTISKTLNHSGKQCISGPTDKKIP